MGETMKILCNNCNLNCQINKCKEELDILLVKKNNNLLDSEVIYLSELISKLISNCIYCDKNNLIKSKGRYLYERLYYYGNRHMLINLYSYISEAVNNKQLIYISINKERYERIIDAFVINRILEDSIIYKPIKSIDFIKNSIMCSNMKEKVGEFFYYDKNKYNGVKWIVDDDYIKMNTLKNYFFDSKYKAHEFVRNMDINILYILNAYECMHKKESRDL